MQTRRPLTRHSYSAFGCIRSSERPSWPGRTADSFIHSFSHAAFVTFTLHVSIHATFLTNIRAKLHLYLCCGLQYSNCGTCDHSTIIGIGHRSHCSISLLCGSLVVDLWAACKRHDLVTNAFLDLTTSWLFMLIEVRQFVKL